MSFTYGPDDPMPTWAKGSSLDRKWEEDDASRMAGDDTRETLHQAWMQLYGEPFPDKLLALESVDQGDCMLWLFEGQRVVESSFEGDAIYELRIRMPEQMQAQAHSDWSEMFGEQHAPISLFPEAKSLPETQAPSTLDDNFRRAPDEMPEPATPDSPYRVDGRPLSADQVQGLKTLLAALQRGERVLVLTGAAGTGKTTLARALTEELSELGWAVEYLAPTGKAAVRISQVVKRKASTIHGRLFKRVKNTEDGAPVFLDPSQMATGRTAFICDEGSMVGSRLHTQVLQNLGPNAVLIYLADPHQLPPVADNWGPDLLHPTAELTQVHRQASESPILQVATLLRNGEAMPKESIGDGYQRISGSLQTAAQWMVEQQKAGEDAIVLCYSNKTRNKINSLVRYLMGNKERGPLCLDEQLVVLRNNKFVGRMNGETMTAEKIKWLHTPKEGIVVVESGDSQFFTMPDLIGADRKAFEYHSRMGDKVGADSRSWLQLDYAYCLTVHKCLHPDTLIETDQGILPIRDAAPTGLVRTPDGYKPYCNKIERPSGPALRIETQRGYELTITPDHGMDVWNGEAYERREGQQLEVGDWLTLKLGEEDLPCTGPVLLPSLSYTDSRSKDITFPTHLDEHVAELFGLIVADGVVFRAGVRLVKRHPAVVKRFGWLCNKVFGVTPSPCQVLGTDGLEVLSVPLRNWLGLVGGMNPWGKSIPSCILKASPSIQARFLRGLFEDGSVQLKDGLFDHIEFTQSSAEMIQTVRLMLLRQGIIVSKVRGKNKVPNIQIYGVHAKRFADKIGFITPMKQRRLSACKDTDTSNLVPIHPDHVAMIRQLAKSHPSLNKSDSNNARANGYVTRGKAAHMPFLEEAMEWHHDRIVSITPVECPSVCLEVPDGHRFLQNGFSGWNSQGSEYRKVMFVIDRTMRWMTSQGKLKDAFRICYTAVTRAQEQLIVLDAS